MWSENNRSLFPELLGFKKSSKSITIANMLSVVEDLWDTFKTINLVSECLWHLLGVRDLVEVDRGKLDLVNTQSLFGGLAPLAIRGSKDHNTIVVDQVFEFLLNTCHGVCLYSCSWGRLSSGRRGCRSWGSCTKHVGWGVRGHWWQHLIIGLCLLFSAQLGKIGKEFVLFTDVVGGQSEIS